MSTRSTSQTHSSTWFKILHGLLIIGAIGAFVIVSLYGVVALSQFLPQTSDKSYWFISRSSGVLAYILLTLGVMWGLIQSGAILRPTIPPLLALGLHSFLNWGALAMSALHGLILLGDNFIKLSLKDVAIPFASSYEPMLVGLGMLSFYLMFLLSSSFYARKWLGQKTFRLLHYASYPTFLLVTWHSIGLGTDNSVLMPLYKVSLTAVAFLTIWRIVNTRQAAKTPARRS
ncbi:MAG: ferric reductase-like transmembrane domain-containing protein [Anaerolineae bacterium]|nr:ferric reductase-like transmembrane domain-containing protein [Anaerolineae bacterium]